MTMAACSMQEMPAPTSAILTQTELFPTTAPTLDPDPGLTSNPTPSPLPIQSPSPKSMPFYEPAGCQLPIEDYSSVRVGKWRLDRRSYTMLQYAKQLYNGPIDVAGSAILRTGGGTGNSSGGEPYAGSGIVDISLNSKGKADILYTDIEPLIQALRTAGFAAWLRGWNTGNSTSKIYIHAIAIGDANLSSAAKGQLTGEFGYFRGYTGIPSAEGNPVPDPWGSPVLCKWMIDLGFTDLRPQPAQVQKPNGSWREKLKAAGEAYITNSVEQARLIARKLNFINGASEDPSNFCGTLAAAILRDAGMFPSQPGPLQDLHSYWLADPKNNGRPWSLFSTRDYELFHFTTPASQFDFKSWPLLPGDFLYTYRKGIGFDHMLVVTEVDDKGRAYTVTNQFEGENVIGRITIIQKLLLYDPDNPNAGVFKTLWSNPQLMMTGQGGFDVLRPKGITLPPYSLYQYPVRPGDTLLTISARFNSTSEAISQLNPSINAFQLSVSQLLIVPVNIETR
jgi:hypothetical protein